MSHTLKRFYAILIIIWWQKNNISLWNNNHLVRLSILSSDLNDLISLVYCTARQDELLLLTLKNHKGLQDKF